MSKARRGMPMAKPTVARIVARMTIQRQRIMASARAVANMSVRFLIAPISGPFAHAVSCRGRAGRPGGTPGRPWSVFRFGGGGPQGPGPSGRFGSSHRISLVLAARRLAAGQMGQAAAFRQLMRRISLIGYSNNGARRCGAAHLRPYFRFTQKMPPMATMYRARRSRTTIPPRSSSLEIAKSKAKSGGTPVAQR